jgi:hypothetical protein
VLPLVVLPLEDEELPDELDDDDEELEDDDELDELTLPEVEDEVDE